MRIVLVDASNIALKVITRLLEARDHIVHPFTDGPPALDHIRVHQDVDALITSAELLSMSGFELCWETRLVSNCRRPIYIIVMSSDYDRHKLTEALDSGADDFMSKPPQSDELYARLRVAERLAAMQHELVHMASTDPLTGLLNRGAFFQRAHDMVARLRPDSSLSGLMIDIDHFKRVNDNHGHAAGDEVIRGFARLAARHALAGRLGGEEFAILLEERNLSEAITIGDVLRRDFAQLTFATEREPIRPTCSVGVSAWERGDTIDELLRRADMALYEAKVGGRNRVVAADHPLLATGTEPVSNILRSAARGKR
jgi:two-component system cell cycle response regulator